MLNLIFCLQQICLELDVKYSTESTIFVLFGEAAEHLRQQKLVYLISDLENVRIKRLLICYFLYILDEIKKKYSASNIIFTTYIFCKNFIIQENNKKLTIGFSFHLLFILQTILVKSLIKRTQKKPTNNLKPTKRRKFI